MNLAIDLSVITRPLRRIAGELREKRLWPVAVALLAAIVAVPVLLLHSSNPAPAPPAGPPVTPPAAEATSLPTPAVQTTPTRSRLTRRPRDPFTQQAGSTTTTATATTTATVSATPAAAPAAAPIATPPPPGAAPTVAPTVASLPARSTGVPAATPRPPRPVLAPGAPRKSAPAGLTPTQSYRVSLAITDAPGRLDAINSLQRLGVLPSRERPMLVELGVARSGHDVLFVVLPGTVVSGPGHCTPGRNDCEILSLAPNQTESLATRTATGAVPGPLFAVTGIAVENHGSDAAASRARAAESAAGHALLSRSPLGALPLFKYEPSVGAVVDVRNLTVSVENGIPRVAAFAAPTGAAPTAALQARVILLPQSLRALLRSGIAARVSANQTVAGLAVVAIPPAAARRAHTGAGRGTSVVIGRGTISQINAGTSAVRLHLAPATVAKLESIGHLNLTIRLTLVAATGQRVAIEVAGRY